MQSHLFAPVLEIVLNRRYFVLSILTSSSNADLRSLPAVSNLWSPQRGELAHQLFVHEGTHILKSGMSPCPVIKGLDVINIISPRNWTGK
jgi:hypothetical protein